MMVKIYKIRQYSLKIFQTLKVKQLLDHLV